MSDQLTGPLQLHDEVRCGVVAAGGSRESALRAARNAEALGYDSIWAGDHISFHIPILESLTLLSFLAAATERIALGTAVYLMPLRPPALIAKITSTLDVLSGGRLTLGIGVGGEFPPEFEASGVPVTERGSRTDEAIEVVRRLWTEDRVEHRGRHFEFGPVSIDPKPSVSPPIWIGGRRPPAFRRAGQLGDGYISHMTAPDTYRTNLEIIQTHAREANRGAQPFATAAFLFTVLDDRHDAALDRAVTMLEGMYRVPFREAAPKYCLLGRPEDCLEQMQRFVDSGVRHFIIAPLSNPAETVETLANEILPSIRKLQ
ncbi:MAG: LLM class flavin-dependent oxidoreductase [Myxococcota bacterium]